MACTTLLVGKNASYDGSTMIARNDDSGSGHFTAKKFVVVQPEVPGGIGEEHIVYLVLPYIHTAREGVERLGKLLETYGTYEMNGTSASTATNLWR